MLNPQVKYVEPLFPYPYRGMETMGDRIRVLREARNLTQEGLGELCGVTKGAVSQWEGGGVENVKLRTFLKLVEALRTDAQYLIFGADRGETGAARKPSS